MSVYVVYDPPTTAVMGSFSTLSKAVAHVLELYPEGVVYREELDTPHEIGLDNKNVVYPVKETSEKESAFEEMFRGLAGTEAGSQFKGVFDGIDDVGPEFIGLRLQACDATKRVPGRTIQIGMLPTREYRLTVTHDVADMKLLNDKLLTLL